MYVWKGESVCVYLQGMDAYLIYLSLTSLEQEAQDVGIQYVSLRETSSRAQDVALQDIVVITMVLMS